MTGIDQGALSAEARFEECLQQTLHWEGGYSNNPRDPGGMTMKGIIQREYDRYRIRKGLPKQWVRKISDAEVEEIYRTNYWNVLRCDELPAGVNLATFDYGVNSGDDRSARALQTIVGAHVDGKIGDETIIAVRNHDPDQVVTELLAARRRFLRGLSTFDEFGNGWMDRCNGIERVGLEWGGSDLHQQIPVAVAHPDPDVQASCQGKGCEVDDPAFAPLQTLVAHADAELAPAPPPIPDSLPGPTYTQAEIENQLRAKGSRTIAAADNLHRWSIQHILTILGFKGSITALGLGQFFIGQGNDWRPVIDQSKDLLQWAWSAYQIVLPAVLIFAVFEIVKIKSARASDEVARMAQDQESLQWEPSSLG